MGELRPTGTWRCGCGEKASKGAFFVSSHDRKAEAAILKLHYGGTIPGMLAAHGYGPGGKNLQDELAKRSLVGSPQYGDYVGKGRRRLS